MHYYIKGVVTDIFHNWIWLENNGVGYCVFTINDYDEHEGKEIRLYIYKKVNKDFQEEYYGFINWEEKKVFLELLTVPGVGAKTAMSILNKLQINVLRSAIATEDVDALKSFGVSLNISKILCSTLASKYQDFKDINSIKMMELINTLEALGFNQRKINVAIRTIEDYKKDITTLVSEAIETINLIYVNK